MTKHTKTLWFITSFLVLCFYACQKEASDLLLSENKSMLLTDEIPADNITGIQTTAFRMPPIKPLPVRAEDDEVSVVGDIEDVIAPPAGTAPATESCDKICPSFPGVKNCENLCELIRLSKTWDIKPGQRFGLKNTQSICTVTTSGSAFSCYKSKKHQYCGYEGKEKVFPLTLENEGNYRVQVSSSSAQKDVDVFIYKKSDTDDERELVAQSRFSTGLTETIHLTEKGSYHIFIDEYTKKSDCQDGGFTVAVSQNTNIVAKPFRSGNHLAYQLSVLKLPASAQLVKWAFRVQNTEGGISEPIFYTATRCFTFLGSQNDYLVSPVYLNTATNETFEGARTLLHP
jgi:hypothetical protein